MAINIIENLLTPEVPKMLDNEQLHVYVPNASYENAGIAKYDVDDFIIVNNKVSVKTATNAIRGLASFGLEFTVVNGHVQLSTSFYQGIDTKIATHNNDYYAHAPAINTKINSHNLDALSHSIAFNSHNTLLGRHTQDHANTLQRAKDYTDALATYVYSEDMNTRIKEQAFVAADNMLEQYNALLLEFNRLKTFVIEKESLVLFDTEGYQILDTTGIPILSTVAIL